MIPVKAFKKSVILSALCWAGHFAIAQSGSPLASQQSILFADSLNNAIRKGHQDDYVALSYPGIVRYYGGKQGYQKFIERSGKINAGNIAEKKEKLEFLQMVSEEAEWQCVLKKTRETFIDGRKAEIISYMVGQSKDNGLTWKYIDVAYNSSENLVYIMPDIFGKLSIPQRQIIFEKDPVVKKIK